MARTLRVVSALALSLGLSGAPAIAAPEAGDRTLAIGATASQNSMAVRPGATNVALFNIYFESTQLLFGNSLTGITFTNTTSGPGTTAQRDAELGTARLYRDDGDNVVETGGQDPLLDTSTASVGRLTFNGFNVNLPAGGDLRLFVVTNVPLDARDGDALDLTINSASDVVFSGSPGYSTTFPVNPAGSFPIDGMIAARILRTSVAPGTVLAGTVNQLVLNLLLPANGYTADQLEKLSVVQQGSAAVGEDYTAVRLFADNGNGAFDSASDPLLGPLTFTGDRWQRTGLTTPVPLAGLRVFVAVDVSNLATEGRALRFGVPSGSDVGIGMASGNDGPIDSLVGETANLTISAADRVAWSATAVPSGVVRPGARAVKLAQWVATNRYAVAKTLTQLTATSIGTSAGASTQAQRDAEIELLVLRADGDNDGVLDDPAIDPVLATASVTAGRATFSGFQWAVPAGATRQLFVAADVSASAAADGDTLAVRMAGPADLTYQTETFAVSNWPLDSQSKQVIDGMVAASISRFAVPGVTLAQGEGPALALDVTVPRNGYRDDVLQQIRAHNLGTAVQADLTEVRWWRDGGDGLFSAGGGDDLDLGAATWQTGEWISPSLSENLFAAGARIFASVTVSPTPTDSATVRFEIPLGGIQVGSANDGPVDLPVANATTLLLSNSPLLVALEIAPAASTVGQLVTLRMIARNVGTDSLVNVTPSAPMASTGGLLTPTGGPTPSSLTLGPGESDTLGWTFNASAAGSTTFSAYAEGFESPGGAYLRSLDAASNLHQVFEEAGRLDVAFTSALPPEVNRGQSGVAVMNLTASNGGGSQAAPVRLRRIRLRLEDGTGADIVPVDLLSQASVHAGGTLHLSKTSMETGGATLDLTLATPVTIGPSAPVTVTVRFAIAGATTVPNFRAVVVDSTQLEAEDANSGAPVAIGLTGGTPPLLTALARVVSGATQTQVASLDTTASQVGRGQADVPLLSLRLLSPGVDGITSDVQVNGFVLELRDSNQTLLARPGDVLTRIRVRNGVQLLASRVVGPGDGPGLPILLSPALILPVNTPIDLTLDGDVSSASLLGTFRLGLADSSEFAAEDRNTRDPVPALYDTVPLAGRRITVERAADTLLVSGTPRMPTTVRIGDTDVPLMTLTLHHPGLPGTGRIRLDGLTLLCGNQARQPLVPSDYLARLRARWNGTLAGEVTNPPTTGQAITVALAAAVLDPGDSAVVELSFDVAPAAPAGTIELRLFESGFNAVDANLGAAVAIQPPSPTDLPFSSGIAQLQSPARDLFVGLTSSMPVVLAGDGGPVTLGTLTLRNGGAAGSGSIRVDHLVLQAADRDLNAIATGALLTGVTAYVAGNPWAQSATLTVDSLDAVLVAGAPIDIPAQGTLPVELRGTLRAGGSGSLRVGCAAADIGVIQPGSALLQVAVRPEAGSVFPLWTEAGGFTALTLAGSYSNFPNPFAGGREGTTFAYYLPRPGTVSLRIVTPSGESVVRLLDSAPRAAGMQQSDVWDGRNGVGQVVRNGVYLAELIARFDDGRTERSLRKVAVVR